MREDIRLELKNMSEEKYRKFSAALIPGVKNMLGIRLPLLRKYAKSIAKGDWENAIADEDYYFEETMLRGMILGYASEHFEKMQSYIEKFIANVDNWSVCDSVFMTMKIFQKDRENTWNFIKPYLESHKEFEIRVGIIIMMQHLLKCDANGKKLSRLRNVGMEELENDREESGQFLDRILKVLDKIDTSSYYASMAVGWLVAEAFCVFPYNTYRYLMNSQLDIVTFNRGLQKILESKVPDDEVKSIMRGMKKNQSVI